MHNFPGPPDSSEHEFGYFEHLPLAAAYIDGRGICRDANRAYEQICNLSRGEIVGKNFEAVLRSWLLDDYHPLAVASLNHAFRGQTSALWVNLKIDDDYCNGKSFIYLT